VPFVGRRECYSHISELLNCKWLSINEEFVYKELVKCPKITDVRSLRKFLYNIRYKLENKIRNLVSGVVVEEGVELL
jgi:hypothetical protein